jgi:hypothetical protein
MVYRRSFLIVMTTGMAFAAALAACSEKQMSEGSLTAGCYPNVSRTGKALKIAHPTKPSACRFGVLMCNACVYDADGALSHSASELCGVCIGSSF